MGRHRFGSRAGTVLVLAAVLAIGSAAAQDLPSDLFLTIPAAAASDHLGEVVVVEDDVAQIGHNPVAGATVLYFGGPFPHHELQVVVPDRIQGWMDGRVWMARRLRIRGEVRRGPDGIPEIECLAPSQVMLPVEPTP